jgi:hypothetical protein
MPEAELEEVVDLEEAGDEPATAEQPAAAAAATTPAAQPASDDWDFVVEEEEESEDDPIADDFHVDLDAPPQPQERPRR